MAIPLENMIGYLCSRPSRTNDGLDYYVDRDVRFRPNSTVVTRPPNCVGIIYSFLDSETGEYKLEIR